MKANTKMLDRILDEHNCDKLKMIAIMQDIQREIRYLPEDALTYVAGRLGVSKSDIYGVATFYENFSLEPKGKYIIKCCNGTACHVRKSDEVQEVLYRETGTAAENKPSDDMLFTVERVSCLGACGLAPVCTVNDVVHPAMTPKKARELIASLKEAEKT